MSSSDDFDPLSFSAFNVVRLIAESGTSTGRDLRDVDAAIKGIAIGLAYVFEASAETATPSDLRKQVEAFGKDLMKLTRAARREYEETGVHPIDHIIDRFPSDARPS